VPILTLEFRTANLRYWSPAGTTAWLGTPCRDRRHPLQRPDSSRQMQECFYGKPPGLEARVRRAAIHRSENQPRILGGGFGISARNRTDPDAWSIPASAFPLPGLLAETLRWLPTHPTIQKTIVWRAPARPAQRESSCEIVCAESKPCSLGRAHYAHNRSGPMRARLTHSRPRHSRNSGREPAIEFSSSPLRPSGRAICFRGTVRPTTASRRNAHAANGRTPVMVTLAARSVKTPSGRSSGTAAEPARSLRRAHRTDVIQRHSQLERPASGRAGTGSASCRHSYIDIHTQGPLL